MIWAFSRDMIGDGARVLEVHSCKAIGRMTHPERGHDVRSERVSSAFTSGREFLL